MDRRPNWMKSERGAGLVEYAVVVAALVVGFVPAVGMTNDAVGEALEASIPGSVEIDGGGGGGSTTTVPPTTTTTVPPTTTTTTVPPTTTTTTVPPTTTTTTKPANQVKKASFKDEISVVFTEADGEVTFDSVEADGWTMKVAKDTGTFIRLVFTTKNPDHKVIVKGWINSKGILKTAVIEKY